MTDPLIGPWAGVLSRSMYNDSVITYSGKGYYNKIFKRLEKDTGINFQRVKDPSQAEINCLWEDPKIPGVVGLASGSNESGAPKWTLQTMPKNMYGRYKSTAAHEIGHALGLQHNHELDTIMSYNRNKQVTTYFTPLDLAAINTVFW
jgi:hypothetical protein